MGYGDEIIASGHAYAAHIKTRKRVVILDIGGNPRTHEMWNGLDYIVNPKKESFDLFLNDFVSIKNGGKCRPYISYPFTVELGCTYSGWKCSDHVGKIVFSQEELEFARKIDKQERINPYYAHVLIEPTLMVHKANPNKQWGRNKWQELVTTCVIRARSNRKSRFQFFQVGTTPADCLDDVRYIQTPTFRHGAAVLATMDACVLPEGGLAHAAGALHKPAVVLFGGAVDPIAMGYPWHSHIVDTGPLSPCGKWQPCGHCAEVWERLSPQTVADKLIALLSYTKAKT